MPTGDRRSAAPTSPSVSPAMTMPTASLPAWSRQASAIWLKGTEALPGLALRLEADDGRPSRRERQAVEHAHLGHERAGRLLEVRPAWPRARAVGRDAGDRQELAEPAAARVEAGPERAQAEGDRLGHRAPGRSRRLRRSRRAGQPRGVADQLEALGLAAGCLREDLQDHAFALDRLAFGRGRRLELGRRPVVVENLPDAGQLEHVADRFRIGDDPEPAADLSPSGGGSAPGVPIPFELRYETPAMSSRTSSAPPRITSSIRSEKYDDQDESRLPTSTSSAISSARRIWQSMKRPSLRRGVGAGMTTSAVLSHSAGIATPRRRALSRLTERRDLGRGVKRDSRRVLAADHSGGEHAGIAAVLRVVGADPQDRPALDHATGENVKSGVLRHLARPGDRRKRRVAQVVRDLADDVDPRLAERERRVAHFGRAVHRQAHELEAQRSSSACSNRCWASDGVDLAGREERADAARLGKDLADLLGPSRHRGSRGSARSRSARWSASDFPAPAANGSSTTAKTIGFRSTFRSAACKAGVEKLTTRSVSSPFKLVEDGVERGDVALGVAVGRREVSPLDEAGLLEAPPETVDRLFEDRRFAERSQADLPGARRPPCASAAGVATPRAGGVGPGPLLDHDVGLGVDLRRERPVSAAPIRARPG